MIVILVPVLDRPHRVRPLLNSIEAATPEPHRTLFIANPDDTAELDAIRAANADFLIVEERSYACKINAGYRMSGEPWLFLAADDLNFHPDWFARAQQWATDTTSVIGTNDLCNPRVMTGRHSTHSLVKRSYIETQSGVIDAPDTVLHEGYDHEYCDDEFVQTAITRGVYVHAFDSIVEHLHPSAGKAPMDATYQLGRLRTRESRQLFRRRRKLWQPV